MKRYIGAVTTAVLSALSVVPAEIDAAPAAVCHESADYVVITRARDGETGHDIIVRAKTRASPIAACTFSIRTKDYVLGQGDSADFLAMQGRHLALDAGTGPDRRLLIFDVATRRKLVDSPYVDGDITSANRGAFTYWQVLDPAVKPGACSPDWRRANADAKSAHRTREMIFSLTDGIARATGKIGCVQTQNDM